MQSSNFSTGSAGFQIKNDGTAEFQSITVRGNFSGTVDGATTVTNNFTTTGSGSFETASSGTARVQLGATNPNEVRFLNSSNQTLGLLESDGSDVFLQATLSTSADLKLVAGIAGDVILQGGDIDFTNGLTQSPIIKIEGSSNTNKVLGVNSSGRLEFQTINTSGSGHNHDSLYDDYSSWTLKRGGSTVGNVSSGFGASWNAGSGLSVSSNNNPFTITYSADFGGGNSQVARGDHSHTGTGISQINSPSVGFFNSYTFNSGTGAFAVSTTTTSSSSFTVGNLFPNSTSGNLGFPVSSKRWNNIYLQNSPNVSSDERKKEDIQDLIYGLDYINSLEPKSFKMKERENEAINFGFLAQDLYTTPPEPNIDIALVEYTEDSDDYGVRYTELIAPLVKAVQELSEMNADLKARIEVLEGE